jgi:hypothetical protein
VTVRYGEIRGTAEDLEAFDEPAAPPPRELPRRIDLEPDKIERGLTQLVLSLVELVRRLMEKQALRRIEGGSLDAEQIERLGATLMRLEQQMAALKEHFEIDDLNIDLGPLGTLFDDPGGA